eukprot:CAMPEP_0179210236 /NCGR_PEP_ID=MMETSP0796-20121207/104855_1 /TAXON_ID=73915 /ORGANISM="Pyrodinium bahamense, Strain pbaha01" /LENGTH=45 /DNA_ID= /DNA_START= /DNA_END= /DNA_ORIENTATION=
MAQRTLATLEKVLQPWAEHGVAAAAASLHRPQATKPEARAAEARG